jgi:hypothetical protein
MRLQPRTTIRLIVAVIAAIVWLYWSNLLFLAGAVLNARVEEARTSRSSEERTERVARAQPYRVRATNTNAAIRRASTGSGRTDTKLL